MSYRSNEPREYRKEWAEAATQAGVHVGLTTLFLGMGVGGAALSSLGVGGGVSGLVEAFAGFLMVVGGAGSLVFARLSYSSLLHAVEEYFRGAGQGARDVIRLLLIFGVCFAIFAIAVMALNGEAVQSALGLGAGDGAGAR